MGYSKIKLNGNQICDYLYIQTADTKDEFAYVNVEPKEWKNDTLLLSKFDNNLVAGNSALTDNIVGYEVRRKKANNSYTEYVGTIKGSNKDNIKKFMIDYMVSNNTDYTYYLYPTSESSDSGIVLSPSITDEVTTNWSYWSLLIVDETEEENVFYLNKMFKFELNLETDDMNNNATVSIIQNFTKYPTVQYGTSNYWSGALTALSGFISCNDVDYIQTPNMINELKALTSDTRRKFLKDPDGNVWEIKISAPIVISTNDKTIQNIKTVKLSWVEVGDAEGISIINNPDISNTSWILTETGEVVPYVEYMWDEHYIWDNSYIWTTKDDVLETSNVNTGRDLHSEDGDK